jgi:hypothetical protein
LHKQKGEEKYIELLQLILRFIHYIDDGGTHYHSIHSRQCKLEWGFGYLHQSDLSFCHKIPSWAKLYIRVTPEGSSLTSFLQVFVGAGRKRHLLLPSQTSNYYHPPHNRVLKSRMALTDHFM